MSSVLVITILVISIIVVIVNLYGYINQYPPENRVTIFKIFVFIIANFVINFSIYMLIAQIVVWLHS